MEQEFKDRSGALIAMGILVILGGVVMALFSALMCFALTMTPGQPAVVVIPQILIFIALSAGLITLGIGTIRAKRWARALMLVGSWFWMFTGIIALGFLAIILVSPVQFGMEDSVAAIALIIAGGILAMLYLVFPAIGIFFYGGRNVRATCEHRNPEPSWTDRCPLPVLFLSLMLFMMVFSVLTQVATNYVHPFFGVLLSGMPGLVAWVAHGALCCLIAVGLYKLKPAAWWGTICYYTVLVLSNVITFSRITMDEFFTAANYTDVMREQMQQAAWMNETWLMQMSTFYTLPLMIYLLFIKRYFKQSEPEELPHD